MEVLHSSEILVNFYGSRWRYIPEDSTLHFHGCFDDYSHFIYIKDHFCGIKMEIVSKCWACGTGVADETQICRISEPAYNSQLFYAGRRVENLPDFDNS
jgi:hypothetical protein